MCVNLKLSTHSLNLAFMRTFGFSTKLFNTSSTLFFANTLNDIGFPLKRLDMKLEVSDFLMAFASERVEPML